MVDLDKGLSLHHHLQQASKVDLTEVFSDCPATQAEVAQAAQELAMEFGRWLEANFTEVIRLAKAGQAAATQLADADQALGELEGLREDFAVCDWSDVAPHLIRLRAVINRVSGEPVG